MKTYIELSPGHFFGSKISAKKAVKRLKKIGWPVHLVKKNPVWQFSDADVYLTFVDDMKVILNDLSPVKWSVQMESSEPNEIEQSLGSYYIIIDLELKREESI